MDTDFLHSNQRSFVFISGEKKRMQLPGNHSLARRLVSKGMLSLLLADNAQKPLVCAIANLVWQFDLCLQV